MIPGNRTDDRSICSLPADGSLKPIILLVTADGQPLMRRDPAGTLRKVSPPVDDVLRYRSSSSRNLQPTAILSAARYQRRRHNDPLTPPKFHCQRGFTDFSDARAVNFRQRERPSAPGIEGWLKLKDCLAKPVFGIHIAFMSPHTIQRLVRVREGVQFCNDRFRVQSASSQSCLSSPD